jgi:hypothetical protein
LVGKPENCLEDQGTDGKILKWIIQNRVKGYALDSPGSRQGARANYTTNRGKPLQRIS